ncbi:MAG TPA: cysteine desulfurase family protein [Bacteroidota bacterium]
MNRIYLDYSATTPMDPRVLEAMKPHFLENYGNASSVHEAGRRARTALEESRETIAGFVGAPHDTLFFTSGGTESDNFAVMGVARALRSGGRNHIVVSAVEHHAVLHSALALRKQGWRVDLVNVNQEGTVDLTMLEKLVGNETALVSIMHANNEVGAIQPVRQIAEIAHRHGAFFHSDAVQSFGKIPVNVGDMQIDLLSISAHKIYGPKGIGALHIRKGVPVSSLMIGGGQEQNRRAGTENVPLAVGFAKAAELAGMMMDSDAERLRFLKARLRENLATTFPGILFNGHLEQTLPGILNVSFDSATGVDGEALIIGMDLRGVAVTSGSACASGTLEPSHVLMAMGRDETTARATIRFSLGRPTGTADIDRAVTALKETLATMKTR